MVVLDRVSQTAKQGRLPHPTATDDEVVLGNSNGLVMKVANEPIEQCPARDEQIDEFVFGQQIRVVDGDTVQFVGHANTIDRQ